MNIREKIKRIILETANKVLNRKYKIAILYKVKSKNTHMVYILTVDDKVVSVIKKFGLQNGKKINILGDNISLLNITNIKKLNKDIDIILEKGRGYKFRLLYSKSYITNPEKNEIKYKLLSYGIHEKIEKGIL